ncbi:putative voltage-gated potassium channel [Schistosoma mansoni]|uniref:putative voltage-gated potassium channel n=1 Tax=Schistosoma mansoni TaxID=6183 RepID=UPI00022DC759|nr:putative voltage-gated potassium channel [Schistosoma mansoni]|eukprot:XP_018649958.1 putative voltage-gated potassium channel [Schistosoma mansoni]
MQQLLLEDSCFLLTNARILDFPIVYVSNGFTNLTEFGRIEVMQKPGLCPFLHGPQTDKSIIMTLENAFKEQKSEHVEVILYKKNLTPLCILVELIPIRNDEDLVVLFLITFRDLTAFRQPLKEESAQTSALGAFAAASDAGSIFTVLSNKCLLIMKLYNTVSIINLGLKLLVPRYRPEPPCPPKHVLLHYSVFRIVWDWTILLLTGYTAIIVPLRVAVIPRPAWIPSSESLNVRTNNQKEWIHPTTLELLTITDAIIDIIFGVDIVLNFHTSFVGAGGEVVADPPVIRMNYLSGWFTLDLLACLPYEILKYCWPVNNTEVYYLMDALRIIRLLRIGRAARRIDQYLEYVSTLLLLMILCFFLLAHWFACAWYAVGIFDIENKIYYEYNNNNIYHILSSSSSNLPLQNSKEKWTAYITALYFSLSLLTTIGFGNVAAFTESEKLLSICCMLIGALVYATIFGNVTTIVQQMYATRTRYNEMMKGVKDFLKIHEVPRELGERVIDYITSSWSVTKGIDTVKVLNYCPKDMQADISVHLNRCVFNSHAAFRLASDGCRRSLAVNFQTLHTAPGDLICHQGESVDQLCFIASGTLEVLQDDEVIAILGKGDVFGDPLWKNTVSVPAAASVRALTYCTLHTIRLDRLRVVLNFYHAFANSFTRNLELTYNLCNRVIFRKLSDVRREMELSMRNKEPPLSSLPANHPVRKLISRFRRSSQVGDLSSRQYLGTIVSYNTSLDGSEFENSSISDIMANSTADKPGSICKSPLPGTHNDPKITTPLSSPVKVTHKNSIDLQPQSEPPVVTASSLKGQNPARKWARLISKATQPPLHNLNEEPNEDSSRLPSTQAKNLSEIQLPTKFPDDQNFTSTPVTTVVSLTSDQNPIIVSTQTLTSYTSSINTISTINSTNLTPSIPCQDLHRIELNIEKCFDKFHIKLSQQINEIVKRLDSLEGQIVELRNTFHNLTNTIYVLHNQRKEKKETL